MTNEKLQSIIDDKNESLERETVARARGIIDEIGRLLASRNRIDEQVIELRSELRKLEITQVSAVSILGA